MEEKKTDRLKTKLKQYRKEKDQYLEGWKRAKADFINYKKKEASRMISLVEKEREEMFLKIIAILDNLQRAEKEAQRHQKTQDGLIMGFLQIKEQVESFLKGEGVEEIEAEGKEFDPHFHEAIEMIEKEGNSGMITEETEKGYLYNGKVIRPSKVKVIK